MNHTMNLPIFPSSACWENKPPSQHVALCHCIDVFLLYASNSMMLLPLWWAVKKHLSTSATDPLSPIPVTVSPQPSGYKLGQEVRTRRQKARSFTDIGTAPCSLTSLPCTMRWCVVIRALKTTTQLALPALSISVSAIWGTLTLVSWVAWIKSEEQRGAERRGAQHRYSRFLLNC